MLKLDEYVRIREAAEYLGVAKDTLSNRKGIGEIPRYRQRVNRTTGCSRQTSRKGCRLLREPFPTSTGHIADRTTP